MNSHVLQRLAKARHTYNHCRICGRVPQDERQEPNYDPLRWWDPDDGWKIGALCRWCAEDALERVPQKDDYAFDTTNEVADDVDTDNDPQEAL